VRIFRFDEDVSIPITEFDSRFRIGPLTGRDSRVGVQVMYLPKDGLIGRHPTATRQFLAVISGRGSARPRSQAAIPAFAVLKHVWRVSA